MILYSLWIDVSRHGLFCHNCNTLTSRYLCVWLACKPASPGVSRTTGLKLITPCQCGKLLWGYFHWLVMTWLWPGIFGHVTSVVQLPTWEKTEGTIVVKLVHTSISVVIFSSTVSARETQMFLKLQFGMCSDELLSDQLPTQFQWAVRLSGSV